MANFAKPHALWQSPMTGKATRADGNAIDRGDGACNCPRQIREAFELVGRIENSRRARDQISGALL